MHGIGTVLRVGSIIALVTTSAWAASNLNLSKSNINRVLLRGKLVTATTDIEAASTRIVYKTPADGDFVLTQACVGIAAAGVELQMQGSTLVHLPSGTCQTFNPGLMLPPDQDLFCASATATFCTITGLLNSSVAPTPAP